MKRFMIVLCMAAVMLSMVAAANASVTTIRFNAASMMDTAITNTGAPAIGDGRIYDYGVSPSIDYRTYRDDTQTTGFNAWLSSLDSAEGIYKFNLNLSGDAAGWGQTLQIIDWTKPITATAPAGWIANVTPDTKCIAYYQCLDLTDPNMDTTKWLRTGNDVGEFSFTAETNGVWGENYLLWVGAGIEGIQADGASSGIMFQRVIGAQADVPEPGTIIVWGLLGMVAAGYGVWRRR